MASNYPTKALFPMLSMVNIVKWTSTLPKKDR